MKTVDGGLQRSQTIGQRIMGNMMDNLFLRNLTSRSKSHASDASVPSSPVQVYHQYLSSRHKGPVISTLGLPPIDSYLVNYASNICIFTAFNSNFLNVIP
jgi:hypothetical protein